METLNFPVIGDKADDIKKLEDLWRLFNNPRREAYLTSKLFLQLQKMIRVTDVATYAAKADKIEKLEKTIEVLKKDLVGYKTAMEIREK